MDRRIRLCGECRFCGVSNLQWQNYIDETVECKAALRHAPCYLCIKIPYSRKKACQELLSSVQASQQQLCVWTRPGDYNSASFAGSLAIVRNGKPFTDGEYAKTFMLDVGNELFDDLPNKDKIIKRIQDMLLSARTVHDRTIVMANKVEETQVKDINAAPFFSLALDESTDVSHLSQFRCKICCWWHTARRKSCCSAIKRVHKRWGFIQVFHGVCSRKKSTYGKTSLSVYRWCSVYGGGKKRICGASPWTLK